MEANMMIRSICLVFVIAGTTMMQLATPSIAQPGDKAASEPKQTGTAVTDNARPNTNTNPTKHRYWRHRGGAHPHYGSRRIRT